MSHRAVVCVGLEEDDPVFQLSMMDGRGAQRAVVDLLVEQVRVTATTDA